MISVIVPLTGDSKWWKRCISSLEQQCDDIEIICVRSANADQAIKIDDSEKIKLITTQETAYSMLCAAGLDQAQGEFVSFVRSCDRWTAHFVEGCERSMAKNDVDVIITEALETGDSNEKKDLNVSDVKAASNPTRLLFNLFDLDDMPWNKVYRRTVLNSDDLRKKPFSEQACGRLIEMSGFARARQCSLAIRAEYQVRIDKSRIGDALDADEEFAMVMSSIDVLDQIADLWEELGLMDGRKTEYLDRTQPLIGRAYNFGRIHFFELCKRFHAYFDRHFTKSDLDKKRMDKTRYLFYKSMNTIGSHSSKYRPDSFAALLRYTTHLNFSTYFKSPSEAKEEFKGKLSSKK